MAGTRRFWWTQMATCPKGEENGSKASSIIYRKVHSRLRLTLAVADSQTISWHVPFFKTGSCWRFLPEDQGNKIRSQRGMRARGPKNLRRQEKTNKAVLVVRPWHIYMLEGYTRPAMKQAISIYECKWIFSCSLFPQQGDWRYYGHYKSWAPGKRGFCKQIAALARWTKNTWNQIYRSLSAARTHAYSRDCPR